MSRKRWSPGQVVGSLHAEDIGAVAMAFAHNPRYFEFYEAAGPSLGGFTGIWGFAANVGDVFHEEVEKRRPDWQWGTGWIDSVDATARNVIEAGIREPHTIPDGNFSPEQREWIRPLVEIIARGTREP